jgi:phosphoribosylamine--glycine ligase
MKVLLIGGGGREHAIAHALAASPRLDQLFVAPGNGGTAGLPKTQNVDIAATAFDELAAFAREQGIDLTVVGPEAPLVAGIVDHFQRAGLPIFGPTQAAAQIEGSKAFSKAFMLRHKIPTGWAETFDDFDAAMRYLRQLDFTPVVKASGLAAGKGVVLPPSREAAAVTVASMMLDRRFGEAGATILIEERLSGPEVSVLAFSDGRSVRTMPPAQDHKRLFDGDNGPNTGGMGAFAPSPLLNAAQLAEIERAILFPAVHGMAEEGMPFVGVLYVGLMLTPQGPMVLEFNARFGDPETQVLLPLLETDLLDVIQACVEGRLNEVSLVWKPEAAVTVVMAAQGYPEEYPTGHDITGVERATDAGCIVYLAGARRKERRLLTAGGRVLAVTALGPTIEQASRAAYRGVEKIAFNEAQYRRDIGRTRPPQTARTPSRPLRKFGGKPAGRGSSSRRAPGPRRPR